MKLNFWKFTWVVDFFKWVGNFFKSNTDESSLRLNMFMIVLPIGFILWAVALHIAYRTFIPVEQVYDPKLHSVKSTYAVIEWLSIATFIAGVLGALYSIWYGKKINKDAEKNNQADNNNETSKPD
jgi:hypothetical protein